MQLVNSVLISKNQTGVDWNVNYQLAPSERSTLQLEGVSYASHIHVSSVKMKVHVTSETVRSPLVVLIKRFHSLELVKAATHSLLYCLVESNVQDQNVVTDRRSCQMDPARLAILSPCSMKMEQDV